MPWNSSHLPRYRKHRGSGQAIVTLNGTDVYLGPHGTKASHREYDRLIGEWLAAGRTLAQPRAEITLVELGAAYVRWAKTYYRKVGKQTETVDQIRRAVKMLCVELGYGRTPAAEFGPLALQAVQARLAETNRARSYVNANVAILKRMVKWGASQQLVDASVHHALTTVGGLKQGRTPARETVPIAPADYALVEATLPHLPPVLADMMRLQRLLGCRPGEVRNLRPCDVDRSAEIWKYVPASHKTEHHGKRRTIFIGPKAQAILSPYLLRDSEAWCFSPADSERKRKEKMRENRKSKVQPSQVDRSTPNAKRKPGRRYSKDGINIAIRRSCMKAFPAPKKLEGEKLDAWQKEHHWHPNQLRHSAATEIRAKYGIEAAQHVLGHSKTDTTEIYAERNLAVARDVAAQIG